METVKNNGGFTLLEVVISIAALSLISVFILQMFLASANLNERAGNADAALAAAITEIDSLKSFNSLPDYFQNLGISYNGENAVEMRFYYDANWKLLGIRKSIPPEAEFCLKLVLNRESAGQSEGYGELYKAEADVLEIKSGEDGRTLAFLDTKKYFPYSLETGS